ncbi:MAG: hypothetical protein ACRD22_17085 [Terriglobia bacterium]
MTAHHAMTVSVSHVALDFCSVSLYHRAWIGRTAHHRSAGHGEVHDSGIR